MVVFHVFHVATFTAALIYNFLFHSHFNSHLVCPTLVGSLSGEEITDFRGGSRNVERGVLILCRAVGSNFVLGLALRKAVHRGL